ncbi:hypothetical protein D3C75_527190 [compost metagenome]
MLTTSTFDGKARVTVMVYVFVCSSLAVTTIVIVFDPAFSATLTASPLVAAALFTVNAAVSSAKTAVTSTLATAFSTLAV